MKDSKVTKRALFSSVMSLVLCVSMLIGTTFAWFTDTATTGVNKIQAGTLDVGLKYYNEKSTKNDKWEDAQNVALFNSDKWEPGYMAVQGLKVENNGNLSLKWKAVIGTTEEISSLGDVIDVYVKSGEYTKPTSREEVVTTWTNVGTLKEFVAGIETTTYGSLNSGESAQLGLALVMRTSAGNEYRGMDLGGNITLTILAKQDTIESDSIDKFYDAEASYPWNGKDVTAVTPEDGVYTVSTAEELAWIAQQVNVYKKSFKGETVKLAEDIDLGNQLWTPIGQTGATQFQGTFDGAGHTIFNLKIDSSEQLGEFYSSGLFGWLNGATVQNVTVDGATIVASHNVGVIAGYMETAGATISNCHVINATIIAKHINNDACGDKIGGIVGFAGNNGTVIKGSTVKNSTISASRDAGQIVGAAKVVNVEDCAAENVSVTAIPGCLGTYIRNELIGRILK